MVTMEHPNGCIHEVRGELLDDFLKAGWKIRAAQIGPPETTEEAVKEKPKTKRTKK